MRIDVNDGMVVYSILELRESDENLDSFLKDANARLPHIPSTYILERGNRISSLVIWNTILAWIYLYKWNFLNHNDLLTIHNKRLLELYRWFETNMTFETLLQWTQILEIEVSFAEQNNNTKVYASQFDLNVLDSDEPNITLDIMRERYDRWLTIVPWYDTQTSNGGSILNHSIFLPERIKFMNHQMCNQCSKYILEPDVEEHVRNVFHMLKLLNIVVYDESGRVVKDLPLLCFNFMQKACEKNERKEVDRYRMSRLMNFVAESGQHNRKISRAIPEISAMIADELNETPRRFIPGMTRLQKN